MLWCVKLPHLLQNIFILSIYVLLRGDLALTVQGLHFLHILHRDIQLIKPLLLNHVRFWIKETCGTGELTVCRRAKPTLAPAEAANRAIVNTHRCTLILRAELQHAARPIILNRLRLLEDILLLIGIE